ncbi:hypothetical protein TNCV_1872211 [Trichonephila clavipes]|nr:hypothetical protein TNCV_1872211 [Trichonephila clavipes]
MNFIVRTWSYPAKKFHETSQDFNVPCSIYRPAIMRTLILFFAVLAIASAQRRIRAGKDHYYASLGRGDVSSYSRSHVSRNLGRLGGYRETHVSGVAVGKGKVGIYSQEHPHHLG